MSTISRVVVYHKDANGKTLTHFPTAEQFLVTNAGTYDAIKAVLSNNGKLRGASFEVHSIANADRDWAVPGNALS